MKKKTFKRIHKLSLLCRNNVEIIFHLLFLFFFLSFFFLLYNALHIPIYLKYFTLATTTTDSLKIEFFLRKKEKSPRKNLPPTAFKSGIKQEKKYKRKNLLFLCYESQKIFCSYYFHITFYSYSLNYKILLCFLKLSFLFLISFHHLI